MPTLYLLGYEGLTANQISEILRRRKIGKLIDIRRWPYTSSGHNPAAFRHIKGYIHLPVLAPPRSLLSAYKDKSLWDEFAAGYIKYIDSEKVKQAFLDVITGTPLCLLCKEKNPHECHRMLLAKFMIEALELEDWKILDISSPKMQFNKTIFDR